MKSSRYLFSEWSRIKKRLKDRLVYLFLDYDGTLTPIVDSPGKAILAENTKELLRLLTKMPNCKVAIISGRTLEDIADRVGIKGIVYVGNHGFEIKGPKIKFDSPVPPRYRATLERIKEKLQKEISGIQGVIIEDKWFSLCVHYRQVDKEYVPQVKTAVAGAILLHGLHEDVIMRLGKMVFEIRPAIQWDKGSVVLWLLARQRFASRKNNNKVMPIYVGDDLTDEDAFRALKSIGITVFVGKPRKTLAAYHVNNTDEVIKLLNEVKSAATKSQRAV